MSAEPTTIPTLLSVNQFLQKHECFTGAWLRAALFHRETNGLNGAILQAGRKILINEPRFFVWLDTQGRKAAHV